MTLEKGKTKLILDTATKYGSSVLLGFKASRQSCGRKKQEQWNKYHSCLGHLSSELTRATTKYYNVVLVGNKQEMCKPCLLGKARQKNVPKETPNSEIPGERLCIDISSMKT